MSVTLRRRSAIGIALMLFLGLMSPSVASGAGANLIGAIGAASLGGFTAVPPVRLVDTAADLGAADNIPARASITVQLAGRGGIPVGNVAAVAMTVQVVTPASSGYLTAHATGTPRPKTSDLNFAAQATVSSMIIVAVSKSGAATFYNSSTSSLRLVADVGGFYSAGGASTPGSFSPIAPTRLLDTALGLGAPQNVPAYSSITVKVAGIAGIPSTGAAAVAVTLQAVSPATSGYLTVQAAGVARPTVSHLNFSAGRTVASQTIAPLSSSGEVRVYNGSAKTVRIVGDVVGYFNSGGNNEGSYAPLTATRAMDTAQAKGAPTDIPSRGSVRLQLAGVHGIPTSGAAAVAVTVQAVTPRSAGYLTVYGDSPARPAVSALNFAAGVTTSSLALARLSRTGDVQIYNGSAHAVRVVVDLVGFYRGPILSPPADSKFSIAVMPDTQQEVGTDTRFLNRTQWLVAHAGSNDLDLRFVTHTGDVVNWGWLVPSQYAVASTALKPLEAAGIPYSLTIGNHDTRAVGGSDPGGPYGGGAYAGNPDCITKFGAAACKTQLLVRQTQEFNATFTASRYGSVGGVFETGKVDNVWSEFDAGGAKWMVLNLELWPRASVVQWAKAVVAAHPDHNVIVVTHSYLNKDGSISTSKEYGDTSPKALYDQFISQYPNIKMVFAGHTGVAASRTDVGVHGNTVYTFLAAIHSNTTNPVRIVEVDTAANTVNSKIFAPYNNDQTWRPYDVAYSNVDWIK